VGLTVSAAAGQPAQSSGRLPGDLVPVWRTIHHSYDWIFKNASHIHYSQAQYTGMEQYLKESQDKCIKHFQNQIHSSNNTILTSEKYLQKNTAHITSSRRHTVHCKIQNLRAVRVQDAVMAQHALPIAYENYNAKLKLLEYWPAQRAKVAAEIRAGTYKDWKWGNIQDIGERVIYPGQHTDIKRFAPAVHQLFSQHMLPPLMKDPQIVHYVKTVAYRIAAHSDLHIPLHVYVLDSKTINAFSIGGGYLFVYRGLLGAVQDEDELAGVIGHETAHIVCRHSFRKMRESQIASLAMDAAQFAGIFLTGGVSSIGAYYLEQYAMEYGYEGLGMLINLKLLGVSRKYELEADHLGMQYAWNAGYDPSGFIRLFSWMANKLGYVDSLDWFYDHPPFYERMVRSEEQIMYLPKKPDEVINTSAFVKMKKELARYMANRKEAVPPIPKHLVIEPGCGAPPKHHYKMSHMIETLCGTANNPGKVD
jgi:Zn-dependent protease with chaperone function